MSETDRFSRPIMIHICKDGTFSWRDKRKRQKVFNGVALPAFSVDTVEEAEQLQIRFCRRQYGSHPDAKPDTGTIDWYRFNDFDGTLEGLERASVMLEEFYPQIKKRRRKR